MIVPAACVSCVVGMETVGCSCGQLHEHVSVGLLPSEPSVVVAVVLVVFGSVVVVMGLEVVVDVVVVLVVGSIVVVVVVGGTVVMGSVVASKPGAENRHSQQ